MKANLFFNNCNFSKSKGVALMGFISCLFITCTLIQSQSTSSDKPNIIYILADDLGYGDIGCYGQKIISTPNIDKLAAEGIRFTQHYAGSTVCAPSRGVLMSGLNTAHAYIRGNFAIEVEGNLPIPDSTLTVAEILKTKGYKTGVIGKWGLGGPKSVGGPNRQGFDYSFCYLDQRNAHDYYPEYLWENEEKYPLPKNENHGQLQYSHDLFTDRALDFVNAHKEESFFLYLPYTIPHSKYQIPTDTPYSNLELPQAMKNYAAMITHMDADIGKIMELVKNAGIDENTIIIFSSDNGPTAKVNQAFNSNGPLRGLKRDLYEGGIRVPMIARWPGKIKEGSVSELISDFSDFLPTACEIAGIEIPNNIDGISFLNELLGKQQRKHNFLYWEFYKYNYGWRAGDDPTKRNTLDSQAVRMGKWKAVRSRVKENPDATLELYNLDMDIGETNDIANMNPDVVNKILQLIEETRFDVEFFKK